ncbi:hypothetical protein PVAP13_9NG495514 [Panicum virgatum]|uniref:Uncharacterized protein n=1 Tax=Panicum virgatum TaxID=38727 RepID=A0A8T0MSU7_PANVG|nr:hypothetical protein PVAP13_9NG495514 [Panicum virgatum]
MASKGARCQGMRVLARIYGLQPPQSCLPPESALPGSCSRAPMRRRSIWSRSRTLLPLGAGHAAPARGPPCPAHAPPRQQAFATTASPPPAAPRRRVRSLFSLNGGARGRRRSSKAADLMEERWRRMLWWVRWRRQDGGRSC